MYRLLQLNKIEILLLCWKLGFENLCSFIQDWEEQETRPRLIEIIDYCLQSPESWPEWYALYQHPILEKPTINQVFYYPGMCFQSRFTWHWEQGFEYRYARRTSIRMFLLSSQRVGGISSDLQSYILSFLLPQELGKEITTQRYNQFITKKKTYMAHCYRVNHCRVGHTMNPHNECPHCADLHQRYQRLRIQEEMSLEELPEVYHNTDFDRGTRPMLKLEMDLLQIKHEIKLERLMKRASMRQELFRTC